MSLPFAQYQEPSPPPNPGYIEASEVEASEPYTILWAPHRGPQKALIDCTVQEALYGGARGGGKTDAMLGDFCIKASYYGAASRGVFFRKSLPQLEDVIRRSKEIYGLLGCVYQKSTKTWLFPNGATLKFRYLQRDEDAEEYRGQQFSWICFEELTQWASSAPVDKIRACLRSAEGIPCYFRATTNPGGAGHAWVKARYITPAPLGFKIIRDPSTQLERVYIPARLEHNPTLEQNDPQYRIRLRGLGNPALVEAWLNGSWDIADGAFFDGVWSPDKHVSRRFKIPSSWPLELSFDWGHRKPASLGIWARSNGEQPENAPGFYPKDTLVRVAEWYTVARDNLGYPKPDEGLRINNERLGERIASITKPFYHRIQRGVADPSIFKDDGGYSTYSKMREGAARVEGSGLKFRRADNSRIPGWQEVIDRLQATFDGDKERPGLVIFDTCENWLRTVPVVPRDEKTGDDVGPCEDHAADETRYECNTKGGLMNEVALNV